MTHGWNTTRIRVEARSRGKTRGTKEIPVYFHKGGRGGGEGKSRCKGKQGVANRNLSRRRRTPVFAPRANIRGWAMKKPMPREMSQPLIRRPFFRGRGTFLNIGGRGSLLSAWWRSNCQNEWHEMEGEVYIPLQLFFVSFSSFFWMERWR